MSEAYICIYNGFLWEITFNSTISSAVRYYYIDASKRNTFSRMSDKALVKARFAG